MSYFIVRNSDNGLRVRGPLSEVQATAEIEEETSEDIRPEYRAYFTSTVPDEYTDENALFIIKGEVVVPEAVSRVTKWKL